MNERQNQIAEAAIKLFLREGVGAPTAQIAKAAGVSNGTLFNAFETKQKLIDAIYLTAKRNMFTAVQFENGATFDRNTLHQIWSGYLSWAREKPEERQIMHLLFEAGLASETAKAEGEKLFLPISVLFDDAFSSGLIRGPNVRFIGKLIFLHLDLVVNQELTEESEALAFEMLCKSIGLSK